MSGHEDRLAGLVVLSAVLTGQPQVVLRGVPASGLAGPTGNAIADAAPAGSAVVTARTAAAAAAHLQALHGPGSGDPLRLVWVLWNGHRPAVLRRAATRVGLAPVATYRYVGTGASPTHLVRVGRGQALRWFATSVRPRWGVRSRLARLGNHLPRIGQRFFDGTAVLLGPVGVDRLAWPGADFLGPAAEPETAAPVDGADCRAAAAPAVLHLGGGATAGRLVLTWADRSGAPTHHTKLAPEHLAAGVVAEAKALTILAGIPSVTGTVPTLLGLRHGASWAALTASHLPGSPPWVERGRRPALGRVGRVPAHAARAADVDAVVTAWLAALSLASRGRTGSMAGAGAVAGPSAGAGRLSRAVASLDDVVLQSVVRRGLDLAASSSGLLHGDLWPGNVHRVRASGRDTRIAVLDWESAFVGHPLVDLLTWLVSSAGQGHHVRHRALDALSGRTSIRHGSTAGQHVSTLLASVGQPAEPEEIEALVLSQMVVVAVEGGPAGGDGRHERAWLDAVRDVWSAWQSTGGSPWSPRREVSR